MDRWRGRVALVTGASVGIGAAICRELVKHGMKVVGCARNVKQVQELAAEMKDCIGSLTALHCDLTQSDQIEAMFGTIREQLGGVDVCINNAGLCFAGSLVKGDVEKWRTILNVNVLALAHCSQLAIRSMKERDAAEGQIININSLSGYRVVVNPDVHFYAGTKFAVTALTEGLRQEMAAEPPTKIRVAQISPGMVSTELAFRMHGGDAVKGERLMKLGIDASNIANAVIYILSTPQDMQVHDILLRPTAQTT
ncbi:dehydrogenase/reductase SDR family member 11-like [Pollicipes pollicipes]|uniref:dehydrogenase/reductase SDR family member 11-like n=1 Tax=Pollicipes pollicipes TaxID=41117 RepID=UPI001884D8D3|nr:dehydrogenase/reductase SDR family member 11-like [Pollicipes pollicipes]